MLLKIPKKFDDKPFQSNALWLNLNKINKYFTLSVHPSCVPSSAAK